MAEDVVDAEAADPGLGGPHPAAAQLRVRVLVTAMVDSVGRYIESYLMRTVALLRQDLADIYN